MKRIWLRQKNIAAICLALLLFLVYAVNASAGEKKPRVAAEPSCPIVVLKNKDFFPALLKIIDDAQDEIFVSMFSFRTGVHKRSYPDRILAHLASAVKRGVKVQVILENTGNPADALGGQNRQTKKLLEERGAVVYLDSPKKTTHTKLIVIDRRLVILGSHNLTQSALKYNNEISLLVDSPDLAFEIRNYMLAIVKEAK